MPLLEVEHLQKVYTARFGAVQVEALRDVNFTVEEGEYVAIMGESGSGKTTLLNILAALDKPTSGAVRLSGGDITKIKDSKMSQFRREHLGFVFQDFNLLDTFSLRDNIFLPLVLSHKGHAEMAARLAPIALCWTSTLTKSPAGRNSAQPWPARLSQSRRLCWRTSPRARWIPRRPQSCCACSARSTAAARPY